MGKVSKNLSGLGDRHSQQLSQADGLVHRIALVQLIAHDQQRLCGFDQEPGCPLHFLGVGSDPHALIPLVMHDNFGTHLLGAR